MKVETILSQKGTDVLTVSASDSIAGAVSVMSDNNIGAVVVTGDSGDVRGILSERDVVRHLPAQGPGLLDQPVSALMTEVVATCCRQDEVDGLLEMMTEKRIRHIPVIEDGALKGIVSIGDVVKLKIEKTEQEAAALREYISG